MPAQRLLESLFIPFHGGVDLAGKQAKGAAFIREDIFIAAIPSGRITV